MVNGKPTRERFATDWLLRQLPFSAKALKPVPRSRKRPALLALDTPHDLIRKTECGSASPITKLASRFMALTAQRPGMICALAWFEIENVDFESDDEAPTALWSIPAHSAATGVAVTRFGRVVVGDPRSVEDLRSGRILRQRTTARVAYYLDEHVSSESEARWPYRAEQTMECTVCSPREIVAVSA